MVENDSMCVIRWAFSACKPPWRMVDVIEKVMPRNLNVSMPRNLNVSFLHIPRSYNGVAGTMATERVAHQSLFLL